VGATVVRVEHEGLDSSPTGVLVAYEEGGRVFRVKARTVVMASGGWMNKHVIADLPSAIKEAYREFHHAPVLVANVALTNWRFLYKLGFSACRWFGDGFGFSCNLRQSIVVGDYHPPLHPDKPTVLTFYMGGYAPGHPAEEQVVIGRTRMLNTMFADYERQCRTQMIKLFGDAGFDPSNDIAGIILNRWGHARLVQPPGWYWGRNGNSPVREVVQQGFGRIAIAHSELYGHQSVNGAMAQGRRAVEQILKLL
jgi:spermidine dehydrogenase